MSRKMPPPGATPATVTTFKVGHRTYEQRYVDCGKANCQRCNQPGGRRPSHGPYWYLCFLRKGRWYRVYFGKHLDTEKFIDKNGNIDWDQIKAAKKHRGAGGALKKEVPGQEDFINRNLAAAEPKMKRGAAHVKQLEENLEVARDHVQDPLPGAKNPHNPPQEDSTPLALPPPRGTA